MRILDVYQKDTFVLMEISLDHIEQVVEFLDHCQMTYDGEKEPEMKKAEKYVNDVFFKTLADLLEETKPGYTAQKTNSS